MRTLANILWATLGGGIIIAFGYLMSGLALCITIIGIPFGIQAMRLSVLSLFPFGQQIEHTPASNGCLSLMLNIIWIFIGGLWIALTHVALAIIFAITIIGIPFARQHIKLASFSFTPFGVRFSPEPA